MWVKLRSDWVRKGATHVNGDVLEVEDWEAERLVALGKAKPCDAPPMPEPTDAEMLDAVMEEPDGPQFKSGTVPDDAPVQKSRTGRKFK